MTDSQNRMLKDIIEKRDIYKSMMSVDKKEELEDLYKELEDVYSSYRINSMNEIGSRVAYGKSLEQKKIDPFVAGGAAQGIAGFGAGVYAAVSAADRNSKIDESRNRNMLQVMEDKKARMSSEWDLLNVARKIDSLLNSVDIIKTYRNNELEKKYQEAKMLMGNRKTLDKAREIFASMPDYKDSEYLCKQVIEWENKEDSMWVLKLILIPPAIISAFFSLTFLLVGEFEAAVLFPLAVYGAWLLFLGCKYVFNKYKF